MIDKMKKETIKKRLERLTPNKATIAYKLIINHKTEVFASKKEAKKRLIDAFLNGENISPKSWEL